jgi:predicted DNA-binding protein
MKRVNYHLPEQVIEQLKAQSALTGLTVAEIIRRAIDAFLEKRK